jgi:hypothetical protein
VCLVWVCGCVNYYCKTVETSSQSSGGRGFFFLLKKQQSHFVTVTISIRGTTNNHASAQDPSPIQHCSFASASAFYNGLAQHPRSGRSTDSHGSTAFLFSQASKQAYGEDTADRILVLYSTYSAHDPALPG